MIKIAITILGHIGVSFVGSRHLETCRRLQRGERYIGGLPMHRAMSQCCATSES